jgi:CheY-like chemotaxis protein
MPSFLAGMAPGARILVVEDDPDLRTSLADALTDLGYDVRVAGNGAEALAALERGERPDVILLDLMMPVMDGWTFRTLQRRDPGLADIPTIVVSASYPADADLGELHLAGRLDKPFGLDRLADTLARAVAVPG